MNDWLDFFSQIILGYSPKRRAKKREKKTERFFPGAITESSSTPKTALHVAASNNELDIVRTLLRNSHAIDPIDNQGMTPLMLAVKRHNLFVVRALLSNGANPFLLNPKGENALTLADAAGHEGVIQALKNHTENHPELAKSELAKTELAKTESSTENEDSLNQ